MKMTLGYIFAFFCMMVFITFAIMGIAAFVLGLISFVSWSLPPIVLADIMLALRISMAIGSVLGVFFVFSKDGKGLAEDFAVMFSGEGKELAKDFETMFSGEGKK